MYLRTTLQPPPFDLLGRNTHEQSSAAMFGRDLERLLVLGSSETALAVARDAHAHGLDVVVYDITSGVAMHTNRARAQLASRAAADGDVSAVARELRQLCDPQRTAIIATSDEWLRRLMALRSHLTGWCHELLLPHDYTLEVCLDKNRFAQWCIDNDVSAPVSWQVGAEPRPTSLTAPFMIRPAQTRHGMAGNPLPKAIEARTESELLHWLGEFEAARCPVIVTESLLGRRLLQYSVGFARRNGRFLGFVTEKVRPLPQVCRSGSFVSLRDEPAILAFGKEIAEKLDFFGAGEIEVLYDRDAHRMVAIEVNARPWLQFAMAGASGHDLLQVLTGKAAADYPRRCNTGIHWWSPMSDLRYIYRMRVPGAWGHVRMAARLGRALARANVYERLNWSDLRPALPGAVNRLLASH